MNEELAATAVWGSQQTNLFGDNEIDGVVGIWYGKGPGVDRCGDVFKHGNNAGSSKNGGVVVLLGDDHAGKSSTLPHQSEFAMVDASIPVLNPSNVQEVMDYGLYAVALSRFSGLWVGIKCITEAMDSSATVDIDPDGRRFETPDFEMPEGGLNIRWPDMWYDQNRGLHGYKLKAAHAFARANRIDQVVIDTPKPRFGIAATGKAYLDVKAPSPGRSWHRRCAGRSHGTAGLQSRHVVAAGAERRCRFADGLEEILVVEEKRPLIESQLKELLYNGPPAALTAGDRQKRCRWPAADVSGHRVVTKRGRAGDHETRQRIFRRSRGRRPSRSNR